MEELDCCNCRYEDVSIYDEPCNTCDAGSNHSHSTTRLTPAERFEQLEQENVELRKQVDTLNKKIGLILDKIYKLEHRLYAENAKRPRDPNGNTYYY